MLPPAIENVLCALLQRFPHNARWAVGCGSALTLHGLNHQPHDLDIFAGREDAGRLAGALADRPMIFPYVFRETPELSSYWGRFTLDTVEIDVVGDFSVRRGQSAVKWHAEHPCWSRLEWVPLRGMKIPVFSLEDLLSLYEELPSEDAKVSLIKASLRHGVPNRV